MHQVPELILLLCLGDYHCTSIYFYFPFKSAGNGWYRTQNFVDIRLVRNRLVTRVAYFKKLLMYCRLPRQIEDNQDKTSIYL
jgi:hypothetical protein